ncbi:helix-turn-helix domain-containing protein [Thermoactinospora rubra]|uniref:helix-turn-helix domain-containing protein n=1 Tax=Thermoactinospora rubra TaxID=1088767 RepID=UPI001F0AE9A8|nr:helix-turn-helix domain-containing protein [Thermoactinospora rubra]
MRVFLELLAREASAVEFEGPIIEARAAGRGPREIAELEQAKVEALKVRQLLRRRARREAELSALYDTAGDLAGLRDLDAVLEAIVHRARQLLGTDTAYMTLHDPDRGDTYMRVTDGSVSAAFQNLRLDMGAGLGGLVAQTARPYSTADYFADARFRHKTHIDSAVKEEGLVAILGVPLKLGQRVIGVLFAANRSARPFLQEEVALLSSLAAHAAVAIDNARLLQETRNALEELSTAHKRLREHGEAVERAAQAHDRMMQLVLQGRGIEDIAAVVGGRLTVLDGLGKPLTGDLHEPDPGLFEAAQASRALGRTVRRGNQLIASVDVGGEPLCTLIQEHVRDDGTRREAPESDERILERAALACALLLLFKRSVAEAEGRVRGELLDDLIARPHDEGLTERARRLGVDLDEPHTVVVAKHRGQRERAAFWASSQAALAHGLAASRPEEVVLLLPGQQDARRVARELSASLGAPATAGAAGPVTAAAQVRAAYHEAQRCADALVALGRTGDGASAGELGFVGLLIGQDRDISGFVRSALGSVVDYDARRGTNLVGTLAAYFRSGGSPSRTAEAMHIHVNTVSQRLERIASLLGEDWQEPERALEIQLALRLHRLSS